MIKEDMNEWNAPVLSAHMPLGDDFYAANLKQNARLGKVSRDGFIIDTNALAAICKNCDQFDGNACGLAVGRFNCDQRHARGRDLWLRWLGLANCPEGQFRCEAGRAAIVPANPAGDAGT